MTEDLQPGPMFLSRVQLRQDAGAAALAPLLLPRGAAGAAAGHHLVWALFADGAERRRDFLWREEAPGRYMTLSDRPPAAMDLFTVETKAFDPVLSPGDRLGFSLRANAVVSRKAAPGTRGRRHDVVYDALRRLPPSERAGARLCVLAEAGRDWLARQGGGAGFTLEGKTSVDGYDRREIPRDGGRTAVFGIMDFSGVLRVDEPVRFLSALRVGFGRARAFGCGLMLIRRARDA